MTSPSSVHDLHARATEAAVAVRDHLSSVPSIALVLGSGMSPVIDEMEQETAIHYALIPHFPVPTVAGHEGTLIAGRLGGVDLLVLKGRLHYYEGHPLDAVTFPIRVLQLLGVKTLILTAATGGIRPELRPGRIVCLSDHLNLIGGNPLRGPQDDRLGTRFPDMTEVYAKRLRTIAHEEGERLGIDVAQGVYACLPGPSYETPAEIQMLHRLGADVVGMSTVPEAVVARHGGMDVLAFALVTNAAAGVVGTPITHEEVLEAGLEAAPLFRRLLTGVIQRIAGVTPGDRA